MTADGREYFKDHNTQTTHWRLPDIAPAPVVPRPQAATRTPGLERFDADRIRVEIESTRATLALVASSGSGPTHDLEVQLAELQSRHATLIGGGAAAQPQDDYVMNPLAGALPVRGSAGLADLLRQRSRDERQRRQQADAELARVLQRGWAAEDREREARAEAERLRRREREQAGTFIWEYRPARAGQANQPARDALAGGLRWEYQEGGGAWSAYPPATCSKLEAGLAAGERNVDVDSERYVDLKRMHQGRWDTGERRAVRRLDPHRAAGGDGAGPAADADADWVRYDRSQCRLLTEAYVARTVRVQLPAVETTVDLSTMTHEVNGVDRGFEVRGRTHEDGAPVPPVEPERPVQPETLEARAMRAGVMQRHSFFPRREFRGTEEDIHFRNAEAQFHRTQGGHAVTQVDYIINPPFLAAFEAKEREFVERYGADGVHTILAFHGTTNDANIESILANNFDITRLAANTGNRGYFGAGIYFSEVARGSLGYARGHNKLLLCKLLTGREYRIGGTNPTPGAPAGAGSPMMGAPLMPGYDSHIVNDGAEVVIFDTAQILPCYVVHW